MNSYARALGQIAQESVKDSVSGFAKGIKGAALTEMPGITALYGLGKNVKNRADKLSDSSTDEVAKDSLEEQKKNNVISLDMVRQLKSMNENIVKQTKINQFLADAQKQTSMFAEEADREKALRDKELLDAIKNLSKTSNIISDEKDKKGGGLLDSIFDFFKGGLLEAIGTIIGGTLIGRSIKKALGVSGASNKTGGTVPNDVGKKIKDGVGGIGGRVGSTPSGGTVPNDVGKKIKDGVGGIGGRAGGPPPGGTPPSGGGFGGGLLRGGVSLAGRAALRMVPYVGWGLLAMDIGSIGYDLYKSYGGRGGGKGGPNPPGPMGSFDAGSGDGWDSPKENKKRGYFDKGEARRRDAAIVPYSGTLTGKVDAASFITGKEGFPSGGRAYRDTDKMAIGYGHNITEQEIKAGEIDLGNGNRIKISGESGRDTVITKDQADLLFSRDIKQYERIVIDAVGQEAYNKFSENQKTGILSYVYNTGSIPKGFAESVKSGNYANAAASIRNGTANVNPEKVKGWSEEKIKKVNAALKMRRNEEATLFDANGRATPISDVAESKNKTTEAVSKALTRGEAKSRILTNAAALTQATPIAAKSSNADGTSSISNEYVDDGTGTMVLKSELDALKNKKDSGLKLLNDSIIKSSAITRSITQVTTKPSKLDEYVDDGTGTMVLKSELDAIKKKKDSGLKLLNDSKSSATSRLSSGTNLKPATGPTKPIQVEDKKLNQTAEKQLKESKAVARQTGVVSRATTARLTSSKLTKEQQIIQNANQSFLNQFQSTTQRLLNKAIYDSVVVGAYGKKGSKNLVTRQQAEGEMFRGQELSKAIKLNKGTEKLLTNVFGKELGKAYAPMVAKLGTAYLEVGSRYVGREMFKGILGNDKNADALTGQILGNFARGNKQAATEQLLYGLTGVASGPETIFAKYGFGSSQQGVNFMANYGAAQITAPLAEMMGGREPTYRGPGGQTYGASQTPVFGSPNRGYGASQTPMFGAPNQQPAYDAMGRAIDNKANPVNPAVVQLAMDGDKAARDSLPQIETAQWERLQQAKDQHTESTKNLLNAEAGTDGYRKAQEFREQSNLRLQETSNDILRQIAQKPTGGSGSSAGGFLSGLGNFAFDLGTSYVANKLTSGIKNPYLKAIANYGVSSAASSFIKPMIFGAPSVAGAAGGASLFTMENAGSLASSLLPGGAGFAGTAGNILMNSGYTTAGNFFTGVQSGMNAVNAGTTLVTQQGVQSTSMAIGETVGQLYANIAPYAMYLPALMKLADGDVAGAAVQAGFTYVGYYLGGPIGAAIGSFLGDLIFGEDEPEKVSLYRVMGSKGNEVVIQTTWSTGSPPADWAKFADTILMALFNSVKLMQQMTNKPLPFDHIGIFLHQDQGIQLALHQPGEPLNDSRTKGGGWRIGQGGPRIGEWNKWFGKMSDWKPGSGIASMIEFIRDCLKDAADSQSATGEDAITAEKLDEANRALRNKDIGTLTKGILTELKPGGRYDIFKGIGYDAGVTRSDVAGGKSNLAQTRVASVLNLSKTESTTLKQSPGSIANKIDDQIDSGDIKGALSTFGGNPAAAIVGAMQEALPGIFGGSAIRSGSGSIMSSAIAGASSVVSSGTLTPTSQTQTSQTQQTNNLAVGGNSQVDNSTTIINAIQSTKFFDPWESAIQF